MPSAAAQGVANGLRRLGTLTFTAVTRLGYAARFFVAVAGNTPSAFRRLHLTLREIYFSGVLSLIIILVSGLFVGMVLALQGYDVLQRYGADESLGVLVALSLVRELGPVVAGLLFASRAGSAVTAEIGLMKATEQLSAMEMMAVDPLARVVAPRFWGGVVSMPLLAALFSTLGVFGAYIVGVKLIGIDAGAFWGNMQAAVDFRYDIVNGVIKSFVFGAAVSLIAVFEGYDAKSDGRRCLERNHAHGGRKRARDPRARFRADRLHVQGGDMSERANGRNRMVRLRASSSSNRCGDRET